jgi:hypothetical protein
MGALRGGWTALIAAIAVLALAGCGSSENDGSGETTGAEGVGRVSGGSTAQFADCKAWRRGTEEQRYATIAEIRGGTSTELPDERAYEIFEKTCSTGFSDSLRLYKLYDRALAFAPLTAGAGD